MHTTVFRLVAFLFVWLWCAFAFALNTPMISGGTSVPSNTVVNYSYVYGVSLQWATTDVGQRSVIPVTGTGRRFTFALDTAPTSGKSWVFTLVKNGVDTSATCTIADAATSCSDNTNEVSLSPGDTLSLKSTPSGTPTALTHIRFSWLFNTPGNEGPILGTSRNTNLSTVEEYGGLQGANSLSTTLAPRLQIMPTAGSISRLYIDLNGSPGGANGWTIGLLKNGGSTALSCAITGATTSCSDLDDTVTFVAGDTIGVISVPTGTPTGRIARWGVRWVPDVPNETVLLYSSGNSMNTAGALRHAPFTGTSITWLTADSGILGIVPGAFRLKAWRVSLVDAPGGAASYTFRARKNSADGNSVVVVTGAATAGTDPTNTDAYAEGDLIAATSLSAGTPASTQARWGAIFEDLNPSGNRRQRTTVGAGQ